MSNEQLSLSTLPLRSGIAGQRKTHSALVRLFLLALLGLLGAPLALAPWTPEYHQEIAAVQSWNPRQEETIFLDRKVRDLQPALQDPELVARQESLEKALERFQNVDIFEGREYEEGIEAVLDAYITLERRRGRKVVESHELQKIREWLKLR